MQNSAQWCAQKVRKTSSLRHLVYVNRGEIVEESPQQKFEANTTMRAVMTIWASLMKCQTIITFQDKYSNDELPWHYALTSISSRQWGVDISILYVEQGMERGRREHGREGGNSWGVEKLPCGWGHHQRLNRWSSWTSHTMPRPHSHWLPNQPTPKSLKTT